MGIQFELRTDHCGLKYLFDQPNLNTGEARWLDFLCEFDFDQTHKRKRKQSG